MPHFISCSPGALLYSMVMVKLTAPSSELSPSRCTANTSVSIPAAAVDSGGYSVYPASTDPNRVLVASGRLPDYRKIMLKLFNLGRDMSAAPISSGNYRFPPAPITNGITNRKIIASQIVRGRSLRRDTPTPNCSSRPSPTRHTPWKPPSQVTG